ncbi:hypothetical protein [Pararhizobium arenae]|uniref:hypothetical protein n=1 Tax=Pararhizobium arenae TaxID=1856850 RepID=UPI00094B6318|nr:hypothetical protein [Pararhizobium arenae]
MVDPKIAVSLKRADELLKELREEYDNCLSTRKVSDRAEQLTHEVLERLRSVLDRLARKYWDTHVAPTLSDDDKERALVYFPVTSAQNDFDSVLGRWRWKSVRAHHELVYQWLLAKQPFQCADNAWLSTLNELAAHGKHIDLAPQKTVEEVRQATVQNQHGARVSYGPGVKFGPGVVLAGAQVDPKTQRIVPTAGVTETIEVWVSFVIDKYGINALAFCSGSVDKTKAIAEEMSARFGL